MPARRGFFVLCSLSGRPRAGLASAQSCFFLVGNQYAECEGGGGNNIKNKNKTTSRSAEVENNQRWLNTVVCMVITYSKSNGQPGKVANPARGQLSREMNISLTPFAPENFVS